jgi:hypothetical protein
MRARDRVEAVIAKLKLSSELVGLLPEVVIGSALAESWTASAGIERPQVTNIPTMSWIGAAVQQPVKAPTALNLANIKNPATAKAVSY